MALIYNSTVRSTAANRGVSQGFSSPSVTIYSGTQPTPSTLVSSWSSYNSSSSNLLWHAQAGTTLTVAANGVSIYASATPSATPVRNGTATWAVIWSAGVAYSAMGTSTIPNSSFMICPVTNTTSNGVVRLQSTTLSTATTATIVNLGFTVGL